MSDITANEPGRVSRQVAELESNVCIKDLHKR